MRTVYKIAALTALAAALLSCTAKQEVIEPGTFRIDEQYLSLNFTQESQYQFIPVVSNVAQSEWRISSTESWCVAGPSVTGEKGLMVSVSDNEEKDLRPATVTVKVRGNSYTLKVVQLGYGPAILVSDVFVASGGGEAVVEVTANIPYVVGDPKLDEEDIEEGEDPWLTKALSTKGLVKSDFVYEVQPNFTAGRRIATISVTAEDRSLSEVDKVCTITQDIVPDGASEEVIGGQERVYAKSVKAVKDEEERYYSWDAETNPGWPGAGGPELVLDGDLETYYCSPRGLDKTGDRGTEYPFSFIFEFEEGAVVDYLKIIPQNANYQIATFNAYYLPYGGTEYVKMNPGVEVACSYSATGFTYMFDDTVSDPQFIKIEVTGSYGNLVKISEIEFYKTNRKDTNDWIQKVFTDLSCSELKPGVTKKDINQMAVVAPYIAKNVAMPLYQNTYNESEREFRVRSYEAYSRPSTFKQKYNIRLYTELDSPAGILAHSGDVFIVCVSEIPAGHEVRLAVNGDTDAGNEFNFGTSQFSQALRAGVNVVNVSMNGTVTEGMVFIIHTDDALTAASPAVKVHILPGSGTVVGFFDLATHDDARLKELMARYNYKYFFLKGEKFILAAHAQQLRSVVTSTGYASGLAQLDNVVGWEKELMGLEGREEFNNHIMGVTTTADGVHMDASDRRIRFQASALKNYATKEDVNESPWGVAHEIGHVNQPAICWESTIESSNNLFSNYVCMNCGVAESRGFSVITLAHSYGKAWYQLGNVGQYQNEDAELHMRMTWQLWNYFHRCGVDPQFWPKLFDLARTTKTPGMFYSLFDDPLTGAKYTHEDPGRCQLMFYEQACEAAKVDLTEFFETWGFFVPVDDTYGQYKSGIAYQVTKEMIAQSKAKIAAHNYPKAPAIQYIEDRERQTRSSADEGYNRPIKMGYYTLFQNKTEMTTVPSYTVNNRNVKVSDCSQAAAVEIRDAAGELLFFSNLDDFDVPAKSGAGKTIDLDKAKFQAVQWNGVRKDMTRK